MRIELHNQQMERWRVSSLIYLLKLLMKKSLLQYKVVHNIFRIKAEKKPLEYDFYTTDKAPNKHSRICVKLAG